MKIEHKTASSSIGEIHLYTMTNASGASVTVSSLGAGIVDVRVPDRDGKLESVALGYDDPADYLADGPCMGKVPGRYANRIAKGYLNVGGEVRQLAINNGPNHLHGGPQGFQNKLWEARELPDGICFTLFSPDGDENYPGNMTAKAVYRWDDENRLTLELSASTDRETVVNLTNHAYWNLDGADSGSVLGEGLAMKASRWLPTDDTLIPTGEIVPVDGTPMDFRTSKRLGKEIGADFPALKYGKGYDNCFVLDGWKPGEMIEDAVVLTSDVSGRAMHLDTDQPGVQVYTGNWLDGCPNNRSGRPYKDYEGVAIEAQGFPDAPNNHSFPSQKLAPGETYMRTIRFRFSTI